MATLENLQGTNSRDFESDTDGFSALIAQALGSDFSTFNEPPFAKQEDSLPPNLFQNSLEEKLPPPFPASLPQEGCQRPFGECNPGYPGLFPGPNQLQGLDFGGNSLLPDARWGQVYTGECKSSPISSTFQMSGVRSGEKSGDSSNTKKLLRRQEAVQAKNRKAQKRFREKQKARMTNLEQEVQALKSQLGDMKVKNDTLSNQNGLLSRVLDFKDYQMVALQEDAKVFCNGRNDEKIDTVKWEQMVASMNKQNSAEEKIPVEGLKNLNGKDLQTVWKNYVQMLSQMLVTLGQNPNDKEVSTQFDNILQEIGELLCKAASVCPMSMKKLVTGSCEGQVPGDGQKLRSKWSHVLNVMNLTSEQEALVMTLRNRFLSKMEDILQERAALNFAFQEHCAQATNLGSTVETCRASQEMQTIIENLRNTLIRETQCHTDLIGAFLREVLTKVQRAHTYVQSYPLYPDVLFLSTLIAEKQNAQPSDTPVAYQVCTVVAAHQ